MSKAHQQLDSASEAALDTAIATATKRGAKVARDDWTFPKEADGSAHYIASCPQLRGGPHARRIVIFRLTADYRGDEPDPVYVWLPLTVADGVLVLDPP